MKPRIAISAPMRVPMEHLCEVKELINQKYLIPNSHISFWDRKSPYNKAEFNSADAVVFILDNWEFDSHKAGICIPPGVHNELQEADRQTKVIFLAYINRSIDELKLYEAFYFLGRGNNFSDTMIRGVKGSSEEFGKFVSSYEKYYGEPSTNEPKKFLFDIETEGNDTCDSPSMVGTTLVTSGPPGTWANPGPIAISSKKQVSFIDEKEREEELRKWSEAHNINQDRLVTDAIRIAQNSAYGSFGELYHPTEQVEFPEVRRVYATTIPNPDYQDPRLLFLL